MTRQWPRLAAEFPDFDLASLPAVPEGWEDSSWHNDACPSFMANGFHIFVNYAEPEQRELPEGGRFIVLSECDVQTVTIYQGDDWPEVLRLVAEAGQ